MDFPCNLKLLYYQNASPSLKYVATTLLTGRNFICKTLFAASKWPPFSSHTNSNPVGMLGQSGSKSNEQKQARRIPVVDNSALAKLKVHCISGDCDQNSII